jgi:hypothetical protein
MLKVLPPILEVELMLLALAGSAPDDPHLVPPPKPPELEIAVTGLSLSAE